MDFCQLENKAVRISEDPLYYLSRLCFNGISLSKDSVSAIEKKKKSLVTATTKELQHQKFMELV